MNLSNNINSNINSSINTDFIHEDTIAAIASPLGVGGVGVIRVSGALALTIATHILGKTPKTRHAHFCEFNDAAGIKIDEGLLIYFKAPHSFTGEDIVELQGHGGVIVLQRVLKRVLELGAKPARAGEFSERAFFNGKLDLVQAEAIHDLINSQSEAQAKAAMASLSGLFSEKVHNIFDQLTNLRVYVEACIDFSDEDIDFIEQGDVRNKISATIISVTNLLANAQQGKILRDGMNIVLAGRPNAGKSSLLNALAGTQTAIVTAIAGTTRDILKERIEIDGLPLNIIDTAGIRESDNIIESEGIKRALQAMQDADLVLWLHDDQAPAPLSDLEDLGIAHLDKIIVFNKIDLTKRPAGIIEPKQLIDNNDNNIIYHESMIAICAKYHQGLDDLKILIKQKVGFKPQESIFSARVRHLDALMLVLAHLNLALELVTLGHSIEIIAEELRLAQNNLAEITGKFSADMLLGEIFGSFCIGK